MQFVPVSRLGGDHEDPGVSTPATPSYVPGCPALDRELRALHSLARRGEISSETAERQINTYLLAPHAPPQHPPRWFMLPLADAPHHGMLPDLGHVIHRVLARDPLACSLSPLIEQCIPRFRHTGHSLEFKDSQPVLLTLAMGLLLGLYPGGSVKRPCFATRSSLFARLHALWTSPQERQSEFCKESEPVLLLACMEYMARVLPVHMPPLSRALTEDDPSTQGFYKRIPALCDELRQWLDGEDWQWADIQRECAARVERVARLKRCHHHHPAPPTHHQEVHLHQPGKEYWDAPALSGATGDEFRLLALELGLHGPTLQHIQQEIRVTPLPRNLRRIQLQRLLADGPAGARAAYLQSRWHICTRCVCTQRHVVPPAGGTRLRLDTLTQRLVCASCLTPDIISISLLGRVMRFRNTHYYVCPVCVTVQAYRGDEAEQPWPDGGVCGHAGASRPPTSKAQRVRCLLCSEHTLAHTARRVDQLTGEMHEFHYCQRHAPRPDAARKCVNARQMGAMVLPTSARAPRGGR
jgi:hypothetical protein